MVADEPCRLLLTPETLDFLQQLVNLVLQVPQSLLSVSRTTSCSATSGGRRAVGEVRVLGRGVGAQVGHALDLEVGVPRWAGFHPPRRLHPIPFR